MHGRLLGIKDVFTPAIAAVAVALPFVKHCLLLPVQGRLLGIKDVFTPAVASVAVALSGPCDPEVVKPGARISEFGFGSRVSGRDFWDQPGLGSSVRSSGQQMQG